MAVWLTLDSIWYNTARGLIVPITFSTTMRVHQQFIITGCFSPRNSVAPKLVS